MSTATVSVGRFTHKTEGNRAVVQYHPTGKKDDRTISVQHQLADIPEGMDVWLALEMQAFSKAHYADHVAELSPADEHFLVETIGRVPGSFFGPLVIR